jgi:hypothetical protein
MKQLIILSLLLLSCAVFSQDVVYTFFKCSIKDDNGLPIINTKTTITTQNFTYAALTNTEGIIQTMVPEGDVTIVVNDVKKVIKVAGDIVNEYNIIIPRPGLLITINDIPANTTCNMDVYCRINDLQQALSVTTISNGKYWVNLSPEAIQLGFILSTSNRSMNQLPQMFHYYTKFDTKEMSRKIELNFPQLLTLSVNLVKNGVKIKDGTIINGSIAIMIPDNSYLSDWVTDLKTLPLPRRQQHSSVVLADLPVNNGKIQLPPLMPGTLYNLSLRDGTATGTPILFNVNNDGSTDLTEYNILSRKVTQKVFKLKGDLAVNSLVKMSYLIGSNIVVREAKTDAEGMITWDDMPLVRAIIWGKDIQPGVILPDDKEVTKPLLAPRFESTIRVDLVSDIPIKVSYIQRNTPEDQGTVNPSYGKTIYLQSGNQTSLLIMAQDGSNRSLFIQDIYIPYCDSPESKNRVLLLPITLNKCNTTLLRFVDKAGKSVDISKLQIIPESQQIRRLIGDSKLIEIIKGKDIGEYIITAPDGKYKVICDMYDINNPIKEIDLPLEKIDITVNEPICIAPPAAVVKYITVENPFDVKSLVVNANNAAVAVYGNKDKIIGWWMKLSPNTMKVKQYQVDKDEVINMRTYNMKFTNENNNIENLRLFPAFPDDMKAVQNAGQNIPVPNYGQVIISDDNDVMNISSSNILINLWDTKYYFERSQVSTSSGIFKPVYLKGADNLQEIKYKTTTAYVEKNIRIVLPVINLPKIATRDLMPGSRIIAEGSINKVIYASMDRNGAIVIAVPTDTTKISVFTPGQGVINHFLLNGNTEINPAKYDSVSKIKITLKDPTGNIMINTTMVYRYSMPDTVYSGEFYGRVTTDDKGEAVIENAVPGDYTIIVGNDWRNFQDKRYGWLVNVPENSADLNVELKPVEMPAILQSNSEFAQIWWLADGESKAVKLPVVYANAVLHSTKLGPGIVLMTEYSTQLISSRRFILKPGYNYVSNAVDSSTNIILPILDDNSMPPDSIYINGKNEWSTVRVYMKPKWKAVTGIGIFVAQITGLPVGKWTAEVRWGGKEKNIDLEVN